jgi:hypothetical protein
MQFRYSLPILLLVAPFASAQTGVGIGKANISNLPGDGTLPPGSFNITQTLVDQLVDDGTGYNDIRGILRLPNGNPSMRTYLVSQGPEGRPTKKFMEIEVDTGTGDVTVVSSVDSPYINGAAGDFGTTDIGWDFDTSADSRVWAGYAKGVGSYDWQTRTFDPFFSPLKPGYGFKVLSGWLGNNVRTGTVAVWDGQTVFVSSDANDESNFHELSINNFSSDAPKWQDATPFPPITLGNFDIGRLGAAFNPNSETVWWHIDHSDSNPNPNASGSIFHEMDRDGNWTGQIIQGRRDVGGRAAGSGIFIDEFGNAVLTYAVDMQGADNILGLEEGHDIAAEMYIDFEFAAGCQGNVGFVGQPYIGNLDFAISITDGDSGNNPLGAAILIRGSADPVGFQIPGINNCPLNISLATFNNRGSEVMTNGAATFARPLPEDLGLVGVEATWQWLLPNGVGILPLDLSSPGSLMVSSNL